MCAHVSHNCHDFSNISLCKPQWHKDFPPGKSQKIVGKPTNRHQQKWGTAFGGAPQGAALRAAPYGLLLLMFFCWFSYVVFKAFVGFVCFPLPEPARSQVRAAEAGMMKS